MAGGGKFIYPILKAIYIRKTYKLGLFLDDHTGIGEGIEFPHNFPLIINSGAIIGKCCIVHPNVLIAGTRNNSGKPHIGNYVFIGNGAKIIGEVIIGDWCFLSPGAIITKNVEEGTTMGAGLNVIINKKGKENVLPYLAENIKKQLNEKNTPNRYIE